MKKITIQNLGPIKEAVIETGMANVIIGPQSMGKSCVLKTASCCSWVEKRIELAQSAAAFLEGDTFLKTLLSFHRMNGYERRDTFIAYESDFMAFAYDNAKRTFTFRWKEDSRWAYRRPQISYIPSERNLVAAIPNWFDVKMGDDNIRNFMTDWEEARRCYRQGLDILSLGVAYCYDESSNGDFIRLNGNTQNITMGNASSGLQSIVPLFVHVNYITGMTHGKASVAKTIENMELNHKIYEHIAPKDNAGDVVRVKVNDAQGTHIYPFPNMEMLRIFMETSDHYTKTQHCELFIEEPENNLFPPTQCQLADWLMEKTGNDKAKHRLFIATHSPYILSRLVEKGSKDLRLFIVNSDSHGLSTVTTATDADIKEICYYGIDPFFNIEAYNQTER